MTTGETILALSLIVAGIAIFRLMDQIQKLTKKLEKVTGSEVTMWENQLTGLYTEVLAKFGMITEYKSLGFISTSSKNFSLDLIGVKDDSLDFIEIKQKRPGQAKGRITKSEKKVQELVEKKKVKYVVLDVEWPDGFEIKNREIKKKIKKNRVVK